MLPSITGNRSRMYTRIRSLHFTKNFDIRQTCSNIELLGLIGSRVYFCLTSDARLQLRRLVPMIWPCSIHSRKLVFI
jgi:hypothetical protein